MFLTKAGEGLWTSLVGRLAWWLLAAAVLGGVFQDVADALEAAVPFVLAAMIGGLGLTLSLQDLAKGFLQFRAVAAGFSAQVASTPVAAFAAWQLIDPPVAWVGLPVQAVAPSEITSPLMAQLAGGLLGGSIAILSISLFLAPVTVPLLLRLILGKAVAVPVGAMVGSLALTVALPVFTGSAAYTLAGRPAFLRQAGPRLSALMVTLLIFIVVGGAANDPDAFVWTTAASMALVAGGLLLIGLGAGWLAGVLLRLDGAMSRTLMFTTGMREFGVASAVAVSFFGAEAALFPAIYGVVMMIGSAWLAGRLRR